MYETDEVNRREFVARARKYAKANHLEFQFDETRGKGSHGLIRVDNRSTIVKHGELGRVVLSKLLKQLGILHEEF